MRLIIFIILLMIPFFSNGQDACLKKCINYNTSLNAGKDSLSMGDYSDAVFEFLTAETAARECGCTSDEIIILIRKAIKGLERQKAIAEINAIKAKENEEIAKQATSVAQATAKQLKVTLRKLEQQNEELEKTLTKLKIQQVQTEDARDKTEIQKQNTEKALNQLKTEKEKTQLALNKADSLNLKNQQLISAFYFYDDKFTIAYKNQQFYFMNKEGEPIEKLGKWRKAENFNPVTGLAKVTPLRRNFSQYIDTLKNEYPIAYRIPKRKNVRFYKAYEVNNKRFRFFLPKKIFENEEVVLMDFSKCNIKKIPDEIGNLSKLIYLDLSYNSLTSLPAEIKKLTQLKLLYLGNNDFSEEERKKIENWLPNCDIKW